MIKNEILPEDLGITDNTKWNLNLIKERFPGSNTEQGPARVKHD